MMGNCIKRFLPSESMSILNRKWRSRACRGVCSTLRCFPRKPSMSEARTGRRSHPERRARSPGKKAALRKKFYYGERDMVLPADEVKVGEEEENEIVIRSDEAGPSRYVLSYGRRYQSCKEEHLNAMSVEIGRLIDEHFELNRKLF